ncbi:MAG: alginate lyase family protein [Planctomycetaceae bacterium]|nr:alginate lyase family protein [Planctomycetaceae bacterium]
MLDRHLQIRQDLHREAACRIITGEFELLNERRRLPLPIDWRVTSVEPVSHLWRFQLHYQEYLLDLLFASCESNDPAPSTRMWEIIDDWITGNPINRQGSLADAWHPFCLSKRIGVWLLLWQAENPPESLHDRFVCSLESQVRYLERHLEWDLRGNHLLENLRTLAMAGAFFDGPIAERRLDKADRLIRGQLREQILPSGEHFERAPMYHAQMLNAVLDVRDTVKCARPELAEVCHDIASSMAYFLERILHPDGEIPLLADSALRETPTPSVLIAASTGDGRTSPATDPDVRKGHDAYWMWRSGIDFLIFDAGPVGADDLPAHAHCDLLNLEASVEGKRLFVDGGVYDYGDGEMRKACRSTAGHNVLQVDGKEQCDMWSRFRVGYRGHPSTMESGRTGSFSWCRATHDAYRRIGVPVVGRWIACRSGFPWICVDWAEGKGTHELTTRLHLAPGTDISQETAHSARLRVGNRNLLVQSLTKADLSIEHGWYCPDFGVRQENSVLTLNATCLLPGMVGWIVHDNESRGEVTVDKSSNDRFVIRWREGEQQIDWNVTTDNSAGTVSASLGDHERGGGN